MSMNIKYISKPVNDSTRSAFQTKLNTSMVAKLVAEDVKKILHDAKKKAPVKDK